MKMILVVALFCIVSVVAFTNTEAEMPEDIRQGRSLLIGLIPEQNIFDQLERYQPLADYLSSEIGIPVKLKVLVGYGNIIDNFSALGLDGAFFGSFTYALAQKKLGVEILARPEGIDGRSTYCGLILVRKDRNIRTVRDMKGKSFAFVDKATTAGYLLPLAYFKEQGVEDYNAYLGETYFAGTHEDAILDVLNKRADICAAKNTVFERLATHNNRAKRELVVLTRSPDVPENGLAVRKDLRDSLKNALKHVLLNMHDNPRGNDILNNFGARRFIETTNDDYGPVFKYAEEIDLNLSTYDYINE